MAVLEVSDAFKTAVDADQRAVRPLVIVHFRETNATAMATASSQLDETTPPSQACDGRFSRDDTTAVGSYLNLPPHKGWWSRERSGPDGAFNGDLPFLEIVYSDAIETSTVFFLAPPEVFPTAFAVDIKEAGTWVRLTMVQGHAQPFWTAVFPTTKKIAGVRFTFYAVSLPDSPVGIIQAGVVTKAVFGADDIVRMEVLEEVHVESGLPFGVAANECAVSLRNDHRWFTPTNPSSPFRGLLRKNIRIEPYLGVEVAPDTYEYVPMGVYYANDWAAPSQDVEATITGHDRLFDLLNQDVPMLPVVVDTTVGEMFDMLFRALGLSPEEYLIDASLTQPLTRAWLPKGKVRDALATLAMAGMAYVTCDRLGRVKVAPAASVGDVVTTWTDQNQIFQADNPQRMNDTYSAVKVVYKSPVATLEQTPLVQDDQFTVEEGTQIYELASSDPVVEVSLIEIRGAEDVKVDRVLFGAWTVKLQLTSPAERVVQLRVMGRVLKTSEGVYMETG